MESYTIKSKYPDNDYPSNRGQKWTNEEETLLLEELSKNMDIEIIAERHSRTTGGINSRRREIAYKLYINSFSIKEIISKTKLDEGQIIETIKKRENNPRKTNTEINNNNSKITNNSDNILISINKCHYIELQNDVKEMKNEIKELKNTINELVEMMKAVYEFEDV
jgi:HAMP domain-containing protein